MNRGLQIFFLVLVFLVVLLSTAGCTSIRIADTHNTTLAVESYNTWVAGQKEYGGEVRGSVRILGDHIAMYNSEIAKNQPDYALLQQNLEEDRQVLDQWGTRINALDAATARFEMETGGLTYDNATAQNTLQSVSVMTQYMKVYAVETGNARQYLIEYVNNAEAYIAPDDPDYWNEKYRQDAMTAKDKATMALDKGDVSLGNLALQAKELEKFQ
ncbi:MAG: hypothetical protein M0Q92_02165 [Methanoregula sp.]|nr:hypothetical protein [Methanoregula sp.]